MCEECCGFWQGFSEHDDAAIGLEGRGEGDERWRVHGRFAIVHGAAENRPGLLGAVGKVCTEGKGFVLRV